MIDSERVNICDFVVGNKVKTTLLVKKLEYLTYKDRPGQYLSIVFMDRTGEISSKLWDNYAGIAEKCAPGTVVQVEGSVYDYKGLLQLQLEKLRIAREIDPACFLPVSPRNIKEMTQELEQLISQVKDEHLQQVLQLIFNDPVTKARYIKAPAAKQNHQAYLGGLLEHSLNVAGLAESYGEVVGGCNKDLLLTGALLHDIGKIEEFNFDTAIDYTLKGRLQGHIFLGARMVSGIIEQIEDFPEELAIKLVHMILSHHGEYEWGSPKRPKFLEAQLLFRADLVDFEACKFKEIKADENMVFNKMLGRYIIK